MIWFLVWWLYVFVLCGVAIGIGFDEGEVEKFLWLLVFALPVGAVCYTYFFGGCI